jgi:predicted methyltransferase
MQDSDSEGFAEVSTDTTDAGANSVSGRSGGRVPTVWLQQDSALSLLDALADNADSVTVSLNLNRSCADEALPLGPPFPPESAEQQAILTRAASSPRTAFILRRGVLRPIEFRGRHYLKLVPTAEAPTLEINGIAMHVARPPGPFGRIGRILRRVVRSGDRVLDTCGGLGYTAAWALRLGALSVMSCEISRGVTRIRRLSPWSAELSNERLETVNDDVVRALRELPDNRLDVVVHDPPRISVAGELYSADFYGQLWRVLVPGGRLYHYTGQPFHRWRRRGIVPGVARRLRDAGFQVTWSETDLGFIGRRTG